MSEDSVSTRPPESPELPEERFEDSEPEGPDPALDIATRDRRLVTHPYDFIIRSLRDQINDKTLG